MSDRKLISLKEALRKKRRVAVAFSGGIDSAFLLAVAHEILGDNCIAITLNLECSEDGDMDDAINFCRERKIRHFVSNFSQLAIPDFADNPPDRCYICKKALFSEIARIADKAGFTTVIEGSNADDLGDYRPGMKALREHGVASPLLDCGFTKGEIRKCAEDMGLMLHAKKSSPCLATRFEYGERITAEKIDLVRKGEGFLRTIGYDTVRLRMHGSFVRIEVAEKEIGTLIDRRRKILSALRELGFRHICVDLAGYRQGSMNEGLNLK